MCQCVVRGKVECDEGEVGMSVSEGIDAVAHPRRWRGVVECH